MSPLSAGSGGVSVLFKRYVSVAKLRPKISPVLGSVRLRDLSVHQLASRVQFLLNKEKSTDCRNFLGRKSSTDRTVILKEVKYKEINQRMACTKGGINQ